MCVLFPMYNMKKTIISEYTTRSSSSTGIHHDDARLTATLRSTFNSLDKSTEAFAPAVSYSSSLSMHVLIIDHSINTVLLSYIIRHSLVVYVPTTLNLTSVADVESTCSRKVVSMLLYYAVGYISMVSQFVYG